MKASIAKTRVKKALVAMRAADSQIKGIRPSEGMEPGEFLELCEIRQALCDLVERTNKLVKGGEA